MTKHNGTEIKDPEEIITGSVLVAVDTAEIPIKGFKQS